MRFIDHPAYIKRIWLFLFRIGAFLGCHQLPQRSFIVFDMQFPVCARCTGLLFGEIIAIIILFNKHTIDYRMSLVFLLFMFIDWLIQYLKVKESNNLRRFFTGWFGGIRIIGLNIYAYQIICKIV